MKIGVSFFCIMLFAACQKQDIGAQEEKALQSGVGRVLWLDAAPSGKTWSLRVNSGSATKVSLDKIADHVSSMRLAHGDILILEFGPNETSAQVKTAMESVTRLAAEHQVAVYFLPKSLSNKNEIDVFHWISPFKNPRDLTRASFFKNGAMLGAGSAGFTNFVGEIAKEKNKSILIIGSSYDQHSGFGPFENPFEQFEDQVKSAVSQAHANRIEPGEIPDL